MKKTDVKSPYHNDPLIQMRIKAEKAVKVIDSMNSVFTDSPKENAIMVVMAAMFDAYNKGLIDSQT